MKKMEGIVTRIHAPNRSYYEGRIKCKDVGEFHFSSYDVAMTDTNYIQERDIVEFWYVWGRGEDKQVKNPGRKFVLIVLFTVALAW